MKRIVIGQRGWVFVGTWSQEGAEIVLTDASVIRRWGTERGLGQLALEGIQPNTILDPTGTVRLHRLAVVGTLDCIHPSWT